MEERTDESKEGSSKMNWFKTMRNTVDCPYCLKTNDNAKQVGVYWQLGTAVFHALTIGGWVKPMMAVGYQVRCYALMQGPKYLPLPLPH